MKQLLCFVFVCAVFAGAAISGCASGGGITNESAGARAASGTVNTDAANVNASAYFTGNGGNDISLAVFVPNGVGLTSTQTYLPSLVQGAFVTAIARYSGIQVLDRQSLEKIIADNESGVHQNEDDLLQFGQTANVNHALQGSITKTSSGYALQVQIQPTTRDSGGVTRAAYSGTCTVAELDNFTAINRATLELLTQLGITVTEAARTELSGAANTQTVNAQTALAKGITAQMASPGATTVEALSYFYEANSFDPNATEAASRLSVLSVAVSGGNIGANVRNEIAQRDAWQKMITDAGAFYNKNAPYEIIYDTVLTQGQIDFRNPQNPTVPVSFEAQLSPTASFGAAQTVLTGFAAARKSTTSDWRISTVPVTSQYSRTFRIQAALLNDSGIQIAATEFSLSGRAVSTGGASGYPIYVPQVSPVQTVTFNAVNPRLISDGLTIKITRVDGIDPVAAGGSGYVRITTKDDLLAALSVQAPVMVTVIDRPVRVRNRNDNDHSSNAMGFTGIARALQTESGSGKMIGAYALSQRAISERQWAAVKLWAEQHGYAFSSPRLLPGKNTLAVYDNSDVRGVSELDAAVWCNALSEYQGLPPVYQTKDGRALKNARDAAARGSFSSAIQKTYASGYRLPAAEEIAFALFDGNPDLPPADNRGGLREQASTITSVAVAKTELVEPYMDSNKRISATFGGSGRSYEVVFRVALSPRSDAAAAFNSPTSNKLGVILEETGISYKKSFGLGRDAELSLEVTYGMIFGSEYSDWLENGPCVLITQVYQDSPGDKAKLLPGDVVHRVNDKEIMSIQDIIRALDDAGNSIQLRVISGLKIKTFTVPLGKNVVSADAPVWPGFSVNSDRYVTYVAPNPVRKLDIQTGDRINSVNGKDIEGRVTWLDVTVTGLIDYYEKLGNANRRRVYFGVRRGNKEVTVGN
jgi:TolB-like protein